LPAHHYAALTPDVVLDAVQGTGLLPDGRLLSLNSYENRVYRIGLEEPLVRLAPDSMSHQVVAKFYRHGRWSDAQIQEEHAFALELAAEALPVAAPLRDADGTLRRHAGFRFALFECRPGGSPDLDRAGDRELLGRTLGRLHAIGARRPFRHRESITRWRHGARAREQVLALDIVPPQLEQQYADVAGQLVEAIERVHATVGIPRQLRVHGDCHPGNILWQSTGPLFVDFDDSIQGPAVQDLWMFAAGDPEQMRREWSTLLEGYEQFAHLDESDAYLIEALRAARMLAHAAWIATRWDDPAFPPAFPWFGEPRYWERHIDELREQLPALDDPPLLRA
jgi:Ser/Thr protein kinase RdoA (MazF antagonist)